MKFNDAYELHAKKDISVKDLCKFIYNAALDEVFYDVYMGKQDLLPTLNRLKESIPIIFDNKSIEPAVYSTKTISEQLIITDKTTETDIIIKGIAKNLGLSYSVITLDKTLEELGADSLDVVEIIMEIEEEFSIDLESIEDQFRLDITIQKICDIVINKINQ